MRINGEWCHQLCLLSFIISLQFISLTILRPTSLFHLCHRHQQSVTPPRLGRAYNFVQPRLCPTADKANMAIMTPPDTANLSTQLPRFHRLYHCLQPAPSASTADDQPKKGAQPRCGQYLAGRNEVFFGGGGLQTMVESMESW